METKNTINNKQQLSLFQILTFRYYPYWPLFAALFILCSTMAWLYIKLTPALYESTATILIKDENKGVSNAGMESLNIYTSKKIVENEIEVIRSKTLMKETVNKLQLSSPIFEQGMMTYTSAYATCPLSLEVSTMNEADGVDKVKFLYDNANHAIILENKKYAINEWINMSYGRIRFVENTNLKRESSGPFYFSLIDPRKQVSQLLENLKVKSTSKLSTVVTLSIRDEEPIRGEKILNTLLECYNKATINDKNSLAANTLDFVEDRIRLVEHDLDSVEKDIQLYKSTRGIVNLSEQGKLFLKNVGDNDQKLSEINIQLAVLNKIEEYVVKNDNKSGIVPSTLGINDPGLSILIQKLHASEIQYERLKKTTAENNPILLSLENEIQNMRPGILENIRSQRSSLVASRTDLTSTNDKYASVLQTIPKKERELLEVNRQQSIKNNVYTFLLQKREETALSYASTVGDSRVVDKSESSVLPVAPKKIIIYFISFALACFLGIAWITIKELWSTRILFRSEIQALTQIPIAAEISYCRNKDYIIAENSTKPYILEQFRQLRAAVGFYGKSAKKTVMVTSSVSGEGKSFVAANFASSLAKSSKKVLLLDLDLRNPRLSNFYNVSDMPGVAEFLQGNVIDIDQLIQTTSTSNLYVIGAGKDITNPTDILLNGNLHDLFLQLENLFDNIIVDTAPVVPVMDAYIISPFCDTTLFVFRHGKTPKAMVQVLVENEKMSALKNVSIIFNGVRSRGLLKNSFGYGYQYAYPERSPRKKDRHKVS